MTTAPAAPSTVERARETYAWWRDLARYHRWVSDYSGDAPCRICVLLCLVTDAASISADLATAEAHPAPDWREYQELLWGDPWKGGRRATAAYA